MKSYRLSTVKYPKYTLAESALVLAEFNPDNKKASNGKPELPKSKNKKRNATLAMKFLHKTWEWLKDFDDQANSFLGNIQNILRITIWIGIIIGVCWLLFNLPRVVIIILFFIIIGIVGNLYYKEKRHSQHLKRKYDEVLNGIRRRKSKEYLKNNIKITASKIQPDELANERIYYLYVTIKNMGEYTVYYLDLQLKLYDKHGHWLEKQELTMPEHIAPREEKEFKITLLQEKYPYPKMSQFKDLKIEPLVCNIFKAGNCSN